MSRHSNLSYSRSVRFWISHSECCGKECSFPKSTLFHTVQGKNVAERLKSMIACGCCACRVLNFPVFGDYIQAPGTKCGHSPFPRTSNCVPSHRNIWKNSAGPIIKRSPADSGGNVTWQLAVSHQHVWSTLFWTLHHEFSHFCPPSLPNVCVCVCTGGNSL